MSRFLPEGASVETLLAELTAAGEASATGRPAPVDTPLSMTSKKVLAYAMEESEFLVDRHIGVEHLLLGLLRDEHPARSLLQKYGVRREEVRQALEGSLAPGTVVNQATREELRRLLDALPDGALDAAASTLRHLQVWPPPQPEIPARIAELRKQMEEKMKRGRPPGTVGSSSGGGSWVPGVQGGIQSGHFSSSRPEEKAMVFETHRFHQGHEITVIERLEEGDDNKSLTYSVNVSGPGQERSLEVIFDVS